MCLPKTKGEKMVDKYRQKIDGIDTKIVKLLNERADVAGAIGRTKSKKGASIYVPKREKIVLDKVSKLTKGPLKKEHIRSIYTEIMSATKAVEAPLKIAYLGPEVSFTHLATLKQFGKSMDLVPCDSITEVFHTVEKGLCDYGVVPIENSTEGAVTHTLDMFVSTDLSIFSEMYLKISHNLMSVDTAMKKIKTIYSHPQVFGQCRIWLEKNLPNAELVSVPSSSHGALIAAGEKNSACIASILAKEKYGLNVLAKGIEDLASNTTRFLVISKYESDPTSKDKTSIMISLKDKVGILYDALKPFKTHKINLTKIESRPSKIKAWKYMFYIDMEGHQKDVKIKKTLEQIEKNCNFFKVLGSYTCG
jgi:chorismate mutase/prephenate dehydratase